MATSSQAPRTVVVFGASGHGKTSMLNELTGGHEKVNNGALGTTFQTVALEPHVHNGVTYQFYDTAGLNEADVGTVPGPLAIKNLIQLIKSCQGGISMLVYVVDYRITNATGPNFKLFVETLTKHRVPVLVVVTNCEASNPPSSWTTSSNVGAFAKAGIYNVKGFVGTCFQTSANASLDAALAPLRKTSGGDVWQLIEQHCSAVPVQIMDSEHGFYEVLKDMWNNTMDFFNVPAAWRMVDRALHALLIKLGIGDAEAKELAKTIS